MMRFINQIPAFFLIVCAVVYGNAAEIPSEDKLIDMLRKAEAYSLLPPDQQKKQKRPAFSKTPLSRAQAAKWRTALWNAWKKHVKESKSEKLAKYGSPLTTGKGAVRAAVPKHSGGTAEMTMYYFSKKFGKKPKAGWPLYINFHSGGNNKKLNTQMWAATANQYKLKQGLYVCPRSVRDTAESWYEPEHYPLLRKLLIEAFALWGVNPDKVYIMGFSMGGWGTLHLAPSVPDRWAAAAATAGAGFTGPSGRSSPRNLRNTPMMIQVGGKDKAFNRQPLSKAFADRLKELHKTDPGGYIVKYIEHKGKGHQVNDRNTPAWLSKFTRNPLPRKIVWQQLIPRPGTSISQYWEVINSKPFNYFYFPRRCYWLKNPDPGPFQLVTAERSGNTIRLKETGYLNQITILLDDRMTDLDQPVTVFHGSKKIASQKVERTVDSLVYTLAACGDPRLVFSSELNVTFDCPVAALETKRLTLSEKLLERAQYRIAQGKIDEAEADLETAVKKVAPEKKGAIFNLLIQLNSKQNDTRGQLKYYKEWADAAATNTRVLRTAAMALLTVKDEKLRDPEAALTIIKKADRLTRHKNPKVIHIMAYAEFLCGNNKRAVALEKKALSLIPKNWPKQIVKQFKRQLKKYEKAVDE